MSDSLHPRNLFGTQPCVPSRPSGCAASSSPGKTGLSSQFSVPDSYRLPTLLGRRRKPRRLRGSCDLDANAEVYLDRRQIRSAFLIDIADGQRRPQHHMTQRLLTGVLPGVGPTATQPTRSPTPKSGAATT